MELMPHQKKALEFLDNGKILYGGVGAGKSLTSIAYYMKKEAPKDVYVITTAKKRDSLDWEREGARFGISTRSELSVGGVLRVDSWNNIKNYLDVENAFFIFDEQRLVGRGTWVKAFLKIVQKNRWILLSATPGDVWLDYAPVFIANKYYKNITEFKRQHVLYAPYMRYPVIAGYIGEERLRKLKNEILVEMPYISHTQSIVNWTPVGHDKELIKYLIKYRWNLFEDRPIKDAAELWRLMRMVNNSDPSRLETIRFLLKFHPKLIIFYNFDYELRILRKLADEATVGEWNGHKKTPVPETDKWVYLVQYVSGSEGWNCTANNAMVLYSLTYSYKNYIQCQGRIDRLDTKFTDLYYYVLVSDSHVDKSIKRAIEQKRSFNEKDTRKMYEKPANFISDAGGFAGGLPGT